MLYFVIASTFVFSLLFIVWNSKSWLNIFIKYNFFAMTAIGLFHILQGFGYIVKVS